jgi:hypothetical protein
LAACFLAASDVSQIDWMISQNTISIRSGWDWIIARRLFRYRQLQQVSIAQAQAHLHILQHLIQVLDLDVPSWGPSAINELREAVFLPAVIPQNQGVELPIALASSILTLLLREEKFPLLVCLYVKVREFDVRDADISEHFKGCPIIWVWNEACPSHREWAAARVPLYVWSTVPGSVWRTSRHPSLCDGHGEPRISIDGAPLMMLEPDTSIYFSPCRRADSEARSGFDSGRLYMTDSIVTW